jgi:hypothetical protein
MKLEPGRPVATSSPIRSAVCSLAIVAIATIPIGACSSEASDEPTTADIAEPTGSTRPADEPPATATAPAAPTTLGRALFGTSGERFEPGTYYVDSFEGTPTARVHVTLGSGWRNDFDGWSITNPNGGYFTFSRPDAVLSDACHPTEGYHPGPMTTLDGLATALSEQKGWVEVTTTSDVSIDGFSGKAFQRTSPADFSACTRGEPDSPSYPLFPSWENTGEDGTKSWSYYQKGTIETLNVFDLDGTIVILSMRASVAEPVAAHAELAAVLDSIRIDAK